MLPQVRDSAVAAVDLAAVAEHLFDGLFVFDHKFPPGLPHLPVQEPFALLKVVAEVTEAITLGTFIARVDTKPLEELVRLFVELREIAGERVVAGLGFGDRVTHEEDDFFGIPRRSFEERLALLDKACEALHKEGFPLWVGASSPEATEVAHRHRAATALWEKPPREEHVNHAWGAIFDGPEQSIAEQLQTVKDDGSQWAVCGYRGGVQVGKSLDTLLKAKRLVR